MREAFEHIGNETETEIEVGIVSGKYHSKYTLPFIIVINVLSASERARVCACVYLSVDVNAID